MLIRLGYELEIQCPSPVEAFGLLDVHPDVAHRVVQTTGLQLSADVPHHFFTDTYGNRALRLTAPAGSLRLYQDIIIKDSGQPDAWDADLREVPMAELPDAVLVYLRASRYCESDLMMAEAWRLFGGIEPGWTRVRAIFDYVNDHLTFGYQFARSTRTAFEAWQEGKGVCRDFAHLAITFCRCMNIPARYANGFLGDIGVPRDPAPMDYNAWVEVWLDGGWVTLDARHNSARIGRVVVARGRDATDIPLIHTMGPHELTTFKVWAEELPPEQVDLPLASLGPAQSANGASAQP